MADAHKNAAYSLVATAPSPASSGTSLVVTAGEGGRFPAVPFNATVWATGAQPTFAAGGTTGGNFEIVRVTAISTDTLTITRAQESSSARTVVVGDQIAATITAKTLTDVETVDAAAGTGSLRTIGTGALQAAAGNDSRFTNTRAPSALPYAVILRAQGTLTGAAAAGTKYLADPLANNSTALAVASGRGLQLLDLVAADFTSGALTTTLFLRGQITTNASAPAVTITVGLYPVTISAGAYTLGTVVSGSTVAIASPGANAITAGNSGSFTLPSDGPFMIGAIVSGTPSGSVVFSGTLELHQT